MELAAAIRQRSSEDLSRCVVHGRRQVVPAPPATATQLAATVPFLPKQAARHTGVEKPKAISTATASPAR
jgi:hypothetical protein